MCVCVYIYICMFCFILVHGSILYNLLEKLLCFVGSFQMVVCL